MKLLRYGERGEEKPAILDEHNQIRDVSRIFPDFYGQYVSTKALDQLRNLNFDDMPIVEGNPRIGACLAHVPNFYCIGLNYQKHAEETGLRIPREPIIFSKASSALGAPFDDVILPNGAEKGDWEIELGVVMGKDCYQIEESEAFDFISGYCVVNDLSERHFQTERSGQWIKGKSCPGFGPIGPYLVTKDEIDDPQNLDLSLTLNGELMQSSNTSDMIFSIPRIISYMSQFMRLLSGDIIATGTPSGVGMSMTPPRFLQAGDILQGYVEGLGTQKMKIS